VSAFGCDMMDIVIRRAGDERVVQSGYRGGTLIWIKDDYNVLS
jgi:hypothetical protein